VKREKEKGKARISIYSCEKERDTELFFQECIPLAFVGRMISAYQNF